MAEIGPHGPVGPPGPQVSTASLNRHILISELFNSTVSL